jgi:hypothetical protein
VVPSAPLRLPLTSTLGRTTHARTLRHPLKVSTSDGWGRCAPGPDKAARFKQVMDGAAVPGLKGQGVAVPAIKGVAGGADLGDAAAQGVVVIVTPGTSHKII